MRTTDSNWGIASNAIRWSNFVRGEKPQTHFGPADLMATQKNWDRAITLYSQAVTAETTDAVLLAKRATAYVATEQWDLAEADWLRAIEQQPQQLPQAIAAFRNVEQWSIAVKFGQRLIEQQPRNSNHWLGVAVSIVLSEDKAAYAEFCQWIAAKSLVDPLAVERAIKSSLLRASGLDITALPVDKFTDALDKGSLPESSAARLWGTRALLAYRSGDAQSAIKYLVKSEAGQPAAVVHAMNLIVLAMARHELDQSAVATVALEKASELINTLNKDPGNKGQPDLQIAEILFREAETKINGKNVSVDERSSTLEESTTTPAEED